MTIQPEPKFRVELYSTGWQVALHRQPQCEVTTVPLELGTPQAVAVKFPRPRIRAFGFAFPASPLSTCVKLTPPTAGNLNKPPGTGAAAPESPPSVPSSPPPVPPSVTRIKPPKDAIKLEDRLYYLLQPPVESWLATEALKFPFQPFPYQYAGIGFLYPRYSAVLADEMGLGKTMQAITTVRLLLHTAEVRSVLLVCPKPLVTNWLREFAQWAPEIPVGVIGGPQQRRQWQWHQVDVPVKIANYEVLVRDRELVEDGQAEFDLLILDEAQRVKNRTSTTSQVSRAVTSKRRWALTGTPVENSAEDLIGIFEFLSPGYLSSHMTPRHMGKLVREHILRRTKDMVLTDLPPKMFRDAEIDLSSEQRETYDLAESDGVVRLTDMGDGLTVQHVFELVLRLKQICNFDPVTGSSSKLDRLSADLQEVAASGKKAIVFSQWVQTIHRLTRALQPYGPLEYHGKIPSAKRDGVLQQFREDPNCSVLLMSYGAGSVGLNLQFAEYVFLFDRWWNPAVEDQAINRAHRIGAAGAVTVTRFISVGTIEERIDQVLSEKRELFETILSETNGHGHSGLSQQEIFGLFNLHKPARTDRKAA